MMVSIKDIARAAGVSHSTVSRALRNSPLVNSRTKGRIQKLALEMGYSPDAQARSLVRGRTQTVGLVITTITDPFIAEVVQAIEDAAHDHDYTVVLCSSRSETRRELSAVETLRSKRVEGVIVTSSRVGALYLEHLERLQVPIVLINNHNEQSGSYTFSVSVDNKHGGRTATEHLLELGHRRIGYVTGQANHSDDLDRLSGYREALEEWGISFDATLVYMGNGQAEGGEMALPVLLKNNPSMTAVFCYNDMTALGLMRAASRAGLSTPDDLSVIGFDDILFSSYTGPSLTTIAQPKAKMGQIAIEMVLALGAISKLDEVNFSNVAVRGELIIRESTGRAVK